MISIWSWTTRNQRRSGEVLHPAAFVRSRGFWDRRRIEQRSASKLELVLMSATLLRSLMAKNPKQVLPQSG